MRIDIGKPGVDFGDPVRIGGVLGFVQQRGPLQVGGEHDVDQAFRAARRLLQQTADPGALAHGQTAGFGAKIAGNDVEERGFAGAVAADKPGATAGGHPHRGFVDQKAPGDPDGEVFNGQHAARLVANTQQEINGKMSVTAGRVRGGFPTRSRAKTPLR